MPKIAGLLNLIAGAIGILGSLIAVVLFSFVINPQDIARVEYFYLNHPMLRVLVISYFAFNLFAIVAGVVAIKRQFWGMALAGAIFSVLSPWGWPLGIASIVFLSLSKNEFGTGTHDH
jgi:hypothetical protein